MALLKTELELRLIITRSPISALALFKTRVSILEQSASEWQNWADSQLLQASSLSVTTMAQPSMLTRLTRPFFCAIYLSLNSN
jgi:hypothetical protein